MSVERAHILVFLMRFQQRLVFGPPSDIGTQAQAYHILQSCCRRFARPVAIQDSACSTQELAITEKESYITMNIYIYIYISTRK